MIADLYGATNIDGQDTRKKWIEDSRLRIESRIFGHWQADWSRAKIYHVSRGAKSQSDPAKLSRCGTKAIRIISEYPWLTPLSTKRLFQLSTPEHLQPLCDSLGI
jgi:hypothetical protein